MKTSPIKSAPEAASTGPDVCWSRRASGRQRGGFDRRSVTAVADAGLMHGREGDSRSSAILFLENFRRESYRDSLISFSCYRKSLSV